MNSKYTFGLIKSGAMRRNHAMAILEKIREGRLRIIALGQVMLSREEIDQLYAEHIGKPYYDNLFRSVSETQVMTFVLESADPEQRNAVQKWRDLMGPTNSCEAPLNTIRGMFGGHLFDPEAPRADNAVHGSDSHESAVREIYLFFPELRGLIDEQAA